MIRRRSVNVVLASATICLLFGISGSAQKGKGGGGGVSHTATQPRPIKLGTSGGNARDIANGFCCSGTLGALVAKKATRLRFILSNTHVFAGDFVSSAQS